MATHEYRRAVRRELLDELLAAGIADAGLAWTETTAWVTTAADRALVDPVVDAHDPAAIDAAAAAAEAEDADNGARLAQAIGALEEDRAWLEGTATLTLAIVRRVLLLHTRVLLAILRRLARRGL